ncbi:hypothetical protein F511_17722 [Dorcoceras hygrometricum]|uniref:Uncharacterized protein n=1 Tax=Dorcoceras hygrometricum TaxID=472368 RepID=A0A2Z7C0I2_9LAMI|nr:hypothetical protein F511_17722 [Dorcoceras hygrometricum]
MALVAPTSGATFVLWPTGDRATLQGGAAQQRNILRWTRPVIGRHCAYHRATSCAVAGHGQPSIGATIRPPRFPCVAQPVRWAAAQIRTSGARISARRQVVAGGRRPSSKFCFDRFQI